MDTPTNWPLLLQLYAQGERNFREVSLDTEPYGDLTGLTLDNSDFSGSFIVAIFSHCSLRSTSFRDANVKCCDFSGADLTHADFRGAALCSTTFKGACLTGAKFGGSSYHSTIFPDGFIPDW
ncbi:MAG: pentapeptide repeat-containing protein [Verrucomicrobiota bacterium]